LPGATGAAEEAALRNRALAEAAEFRVRLELLRGLFNHIRVVLFANLGTMVLVLTLLWQQENRAWLAVWAAALSLVAIGRLMLSRAFRRAAVTPATIGRWSSAHAGATAAQGIAWGASAYLIPVQDPASFLVVAVIAIAALTLVALISYSAHVPTAAAFVVPSVLPYAAELALGESALGVWAVPLCLGWLAGALLVALSLHRRQRRDIARQIEREELIGKLEAARDEARRANEAKTRFLGHMSHELRTPLNAILGFSEMIMTRHVEAPGPKFDGYMKNIHDSGRHLLRLVSDILDLTRIDAGRFALEVEMVDAGALLADAVALFREEARKDGIEIEVEHAAPPPMLRADATRLRQVIYNLLSNALKYSPPNDTVRVATRRGEGGEFAIAIGDHGQGMTQEEIALAGVPFQQLDTRDQERTSYPAKRGSYASPGTGLGFPLVAAAPSSRARRERDARRPS
jgi:two-component system cell cycle sensor histidine kinase PleC